MGDIIGIISEIVVLVFNILIYMQLTVLKKDCFVSRAVMYGGCAVILGVFFVCTATGVLPEALASFVCVTLPSFILFFILSKYKDFRFFVTFCFLDTVTLILTFFSRAAELAWGDVPGLIAAVAVCLLMLVVYVKGRNLFGRYRELMANVHDGWAVMAISTLLIYMLLIFAASYPAPLKERVEYLPVYALLSVTILTMYGVFVTSLLQKRKLADLNAQLIEEQKWHKIAYNDALTGMKNRMAYMEWANELERTAKPTQSIHIAMIDIDNFKAINDTLGHHIGDRTLQSAARLLDRVFAEEHYATFRIGGDEFAVIAVDVPVQTLEEKIASLNEPGAEDDMGCSFSVGYATADLEQKNAMEHALVRADRAMYQEKMKAKIGASV